MDYGLRAQIESDLADCIEGEFGVPVSLTDPNGVVYDTNANNTTLPLLARVLYDQRKETVNKSGDPVIVYETVVTLRRSSLARVPAAGERWKVSIPKDSTVGAPYSTFLVTLGRANESGRSIGYISLYPSDAEQVASS
jgi:hypothetical protein